jgi:hypothetical protein
MRWNDHKNFNLVDSHEYTLINILFEQTSCSYTYIKVNWIIEKQHALTVHIGNAIEHLVKMRAKHKNTFENAMFSNVRNVNSAL